jgi:hypothetical protein
MPPPLFAHPLRHYAIFNKVPCITRGVQNAYPAGELPAPGKPVAVNEPNPVLAGEPPASAPKPPPAGTPPASAPKPPLAGEVASAAKPPLLAGGGASAPKPPVPAGGAGILPN